MPGRRLPRDFSRSLQPAFEQLQLPWLCPAIYNRGQVLVLPSTQRRKTTNGAQRRPLTPLTMHPHPVATFRSSRQERRYAFAASPSYQDPVDDSYIPIVSEGPLVTPPWGAGPVTLPPFDPANPLIIDEFNPSRQEVFRSESLGWKYEELGKIHQNLEACLAVGLYERAAATMRYLNMAYKPDRPEVIIANNFYIGHMLGQYMTTLEAEILHSVQKWLHVEMIKKGIKPDAATYALMIQLVMRDENRARAARSVRRYAHSAEVDSLLDDVRTELGNVVPASEYKQLTQMAPQFFNVSVLPKDALELEQKIGGQQNQVNTPTSTSDSPMVASVDQKGQGLQTLKNALAAFSDAKLTREATLETEANTEKQLRIEEDSALSALERWRSDKDEVKNRGGIDGSLRAPEVMQLILSWHEQLVPILREEITRWKEEEIPHRKKTGTTNYEPYFRFISPERLSMASIVSTLNLVAGGSFSNLQVPVTRVVVSIANMIERESSAEWAKVRSKNRSARRRLISNSKSFSALQDVFSAEVDPPEWDHGIRVQVGAAVLSALLKVAKLPLHSETNHGTGKSEVKQALEQRMSFSRGRRLGVISFHRDLIEMLSREPGISAIVKFLPMLTLPQPWKRFREGAYLRNGANIVRLPSHSFQAKSYIELAIENGDMRHVLQALDVLGRVPWRVNRSVFEVMLQVWNSGESLAKIPPMYPTANMPEPPPPDASEKTRFAYMLDKQKARNELAGLHSERCSQNFKMEVAKAYLNETFYLPHNLDFRGRAYPVPPYLNHMGADHCRGLLLFGKGKALGPKGLEWLKIHLANVFGYDKASLSERRLFTENSINEVIDSANNPLTGRRWWLSAEDPWQCLASCFELRDALASSDPTKFVSHLPIHQDGTCNGLQHYAALGGDEAGAKQVNLEPGERPSDIYSKVAELVKSYIAEDAATGSEIAIMLKDKIVRKVVKQTVMTNVYGVTFQGSRLQVFKQLEDLYPDVFSRDSNYAFTAATYISRQIFRAMSSIFNGASAIQQWLGECASRVCEALTPEQIESLRRECDVTSSDMAIKQFTVRAKREHAPDTLLENTRFKTTVIWTTPLRMPVVQPYRLTASKKINTDLQSISLQMPTASDSVAKRKQLQAFPPNFIHSLDATHMLLSALHCEERGLSFAAVHDSFWTHACDIDTLNTTLREAFIEMHSEDIVGRLASEFKARYKGCMYMGYVHKKSPLGKRITALRKGIRNAKVVEVVTEQKRLDFLASDNPELRTQGEAMVTAGSLYAQATEQDFKAPKETNRTHRKATAVETTKSCVNDETLDAEDESAFTEGWETIEGTRMDEHLDIEAIEEGTESSPRSSDTSAGRGKTQKVTGSDKVWVWLPLTFPPVPKKGGWNVARLRKSKYFFS